MFWVSRRLTIMCSDVLPPTAVLACSPSGLHSQTGVAVFVHVIKRIQAGHAICVRQ